MKLDIVYFQNKIKELEKHLNGKNKMFTSERDENGRMRIVEMCKTNSTKTKLGNRETF